jgi:hypothetical protein
MPPPVYKNLQKVADVCNSLVGKQGSLAVVFDGQTFPVADCNPVGSTMESVISPFLLKGCPDFRKGPSNKKPDYLAADDWDFEQKVFIGSPGFDLGSVQSLINQLSDKKKGGLIKKLFKTKYLVFKYSMTGATITFTNFWMLNIWDLPSYVDTYPISLQNKDGVWVNFRPQAASSWTDTSKTPRLFIEKFLECVELCPQLDAAKKLAVKASITEQMAEAETLGFL